MASDSDPTDFLSDNDVANYVVCPEAWRLKHSGEARADLQNNPAEAAAQRKEVKDTYSLYSQMRSYARVIYLLLVLLVCALFTVDLIGARFALFRSNDAPQPNGGVSVSVPDIPFEVLVLMLILAALIFLWDLFERRKRSLRQSVGLDEKTELIAAKGAEYLPSPSYKLKNEQLTSKPDALVRDDHMLIPVMHSPLGKKVYDRHVVPLLLQMRLIEKIEGVRPEYGILILGKEKRVIKIKNTPDKQRWLATLIDEMRSILDLGVPAVPKPTKAKCRRCDVRSACSHSAWKDD